MTTVLECREELTDALSAAGIAVTFAAHLQAAPTATRATFVASPAAPAQVMAAVTALGPRLVIVGPSDEASFSCMLLGDHSLEVSISTPEGLCSTEAVLDLDAFLDAPPDPQLLAHATELWDQHLATLELSPHGDVHEHRAAVEAAVAQRYPTLTPAQHAALERAVGGSSRDPHEDLRVRHGAQIRQQARALAEQVWDEDGPFEGRFPRAMQRDAAYAWLRRLDPVCVTKALSEPVALALGDLAAQHAARSQ